MTAIQLLWFRQDLRVQDNPALLAAVQQGAVVPLYILDDVNAGDWRMGGASRWWLHHSLDALNHTLQGRLQLFRGDPQRLIPALLQRWGAQGICWNRCYEPWRVQRDRQLKWELEQAGYTVTSCNGSLLWEPWQVLKRDGSPYKVFTPYYRKGCLRSEQPRLPQPAPENVEFAEVEPDGIALEELQLLPTLPWDAGFYGSWQPGETGAAAQLAAFLEDNVQRYRQARDIPGQAATSRLSPHLHFGELSPNQIWYAAQGTDSARRAAADLDCFLSELGWREFSYYLLFHFPLLPEKNFQSKFDRFPWRQNSEVLRAWQRGRTGIPIVDAGMRELWQTGYMHNRVRMIVGSLLVKNLGQHWHCGARWFWDCLLDADLASNSASWQWVAGSGADAAPYFRIFNPVTQGEKFDAAGVYVRRFCPELSALPDRYLHQPWTAPAAVLSAANVELGVSYPWPIVDLKTSRQQALDAFAGMKKSHTS